MAEAPELPARVPLVAYRLFRWVHRRIEGLLRRMIPPHFYLAELVVSRWRVHALVAMVRLGLAEALAEGPHSAEDLATALGLRATSLSRLLAALASDGLLDLQPDGRYALNRLSRPLLADHPQTMRHLVLDTTSERNLRLWAHLDHSVRHDAPSWDIVFEEDSLWTWFATQPEAARDFHLGQQEVGRDSAGHIVEAFGFTPGPVVVDLGGGVGDFLAVLLRLHPEARGILIDTPEALAGAPAILARHQVSARCELVEGDIYAGIPAGHDTYLVKNIIHGHPDAELLGTLRLWREALEPGAKLVVIDILVVEHNPSTAYLDLQLLVESRGGRLRTIGEIQALLEAAGLRVEAVNPTPGPWSVIVSSPV